MGEGSPPDQRCRFWPGALIVGELLMSLNLNSIPEGKVRCGEYARDRLSLTQPLSESIG